MSVDSHRYPLAFQRIPEGLATKPLLIPTQYDSLLIHLRAVRKEWTAYLLNGRALLKAQLNKSGLHLLATSQRPDTANFTTLSPDTVILKSRLKDAKAIVRKMQRFDEPLNSMLDIWGYRVIINAASELDYVKEIILSSWESPSNAELLLRNGTLQFSAVRDYRVKKHAGLSPATSNSYDDAIHISRRADFGICEIQVMTLDLYERAFLRRSTDEAHARFASRRREATKK